MFGLFKQSLPQAPKTLGQLGEEIAQKEYREKGFTIIAKNEYHRKGKRLGEIDFIAKNKSTLVFVEVKTRQNEKGFFGSPLEAVNLFKQRKILKAVKLYLLKHQDLMNLKPQIDVCVVILPSLDSGAASVKIYTNAVEDWN